MNRKRGVTALVPCYNEAKRIEAVLSALTQSPLVDMIIVVDDCSTDDSVKTISQFEHVRLVQLPHHVGKGLAIKKGVEAITTDITFLCDADLRGLDNQKLTNLIEPVLHNEYQVCIGILKKGGNYFQYLRKNFFPVISGQRVIRTDILQAVLSSAYAEGWGIEPYMNFYIKKYTIKSKKIDLENVGDILHLRKRGFLSFSTRLCFYCKIYIQLLFCYT